MSDLKQKLDTMKSLTEKLAEIKQRAEAQSELYIAHQDIPALLAVIECQRKHMKIMAGALCTVTGGNAEGLMNAFDDQIAHLIEERTK